MLMRVLASGFKFFPLTVKSAQCLGNVAALKMLSSTPSFLKELGWTAVQEGGPFRGPKLGSCLTLGNVLSEETQVLTKREVLLGKGGQGDPGGLLGFYGDGISFRSSLAHHSDSESFLVVHALFSQDGCRRGGFWEVVGHRGVSF